VDDREENADLNNDMNKDMSKESIELVTEAIFEALYHRGDLDLRELRKSVAAPEHVFDMAIGALVEKDDVQLIQNGELFTAHRTSPAIAIFPFRGN
jgi:nucleoid DNA-binding protein